MMDLVIDFKDTLDQFEEAIDALLIEIRNAVEQALESMAEEIIRESEFEVPVDTGTLKYSSFRGDVIAQEDKLLIHFGYASPQTDRINPETGKPASRYAAEVHEDLSVFHVVGKAKFLEDPTIAYADEFSIQLLQAVNEGAHAAGGKQ